jgi:hypothetical protein
MQGVSSEQHTAQTQRGDHLLGSRDLVALDVDFGVRQQDRGIRGEGAQRLGRLLVVEVVEATLQGLAVERHDRHPARFRRRQQASGVLAKRLFQGVAVKHLQDGAQRVERRRWIQGAAEQGDRTVRRCSRKQIVWRYEVAPDSSASTVNSSNGSKG